MIRSSLAIARRILFCCFWFSASLAQSTEPSKPNVVLVLLDNVGQEWFGCYGSEEQCTPNIDQLAQTGVRVENCYTPPVCGPSRTVLLTGRYPHSTGFRLHHDAALYSGGGLDPKRELVFPRLLRDAGYATAITGKWQINNLYDEPDALARHGFQDSVVWPGSIDATKLSATEMARFHDIVKREAYEEAVAFNQHIESRYWDPVFFRNGQRVEDNLNGVFGPDVSHSFAIDFLQRHQHKPFLLYLPMVLTHGRSFTQNVVPTPHNLDPDRPHHDMFADMLRYADGLVGKVVSELERLGLRENTYIFVASDNGTEKSMQARRDGRVVQGDLYSLSESGGNVVLLANCPHRIPGGRTIPLADFTDIYPTVCELTSVPLSDQHRPDGVSFASYLLNKPGAAPHREWILNEYHETRVVRDKQFKLYSDGRLFDANNDPAELINLSASENVNIVDAKTRLQKVLDALPADTPPPFPLRSLSAFKIREATTTVSISNEKWLINGQLTNRGTQAEGLLMNVRMVNATFEDSSGKKPDFDANANTENFIARIPEYAANGVNAFTLCLQGGMPGYEGAVNTAFRSDGSLNPAYLQRVERVIRACAKDGVVVILGCYYQRQSKRLQDEDAVRTGLIEVVKWIRSNSFRNVVLEVANEYPHPGFSHELIRSEKGQASLIRLVKATMPDLLVTASGYGDGKIHREVAEVCDFLTPHWNGTNVEDIPARVDSLKQFHKPIVCNEDDKVGSQAVAAMNASVKSGAAYGLMLKDHNQTFPFHFDGVSDDTAFYAALKAISPRQ
ncbi:MAG: sulfatase-like hydrolase/transferase [Pirellulaceae bacterium]|nr:sulfatase-like hydrolase/transferase [Pirellulaceae bacterium]